MPAGTGERDDGGSRQAGAHGRPTAAPSHHVDPATELLQRDASRARLPREIIDSRHGFQEVNDEAAPADLLIDERLPRRP
jgi:hypothetical protein